MAMISVRRDGRVGAELWPRTWPTLLVGVVITLLIWTRPDLRSTDPAMVAWLSLGCLFLSAFAVQSASQRGWLGVPSIYLYVFGAFHLGLAPSIALGWAIPDFGNPSGARWISSGFVAEALFAVAVSALAFAIGTRLGSASGSRSTPEVTGEDEARLSNRAATIAFAAALAGVGGWVVFVLSRGGVAAFGRSYGNYLEITRGGPLPLIYLMLGLAGALWAVAPSHRLSRRAVMMLVLFAVLALPLGLRGEVLFPLTGGIAVYASRLTRVRPWRWALVVVVLLGAVAAIRTVRTTGLTERSPVIDANPVNGLAELGYSLRPVVEAMSWRSIDPPAYGRTYVRPLERAAARLVPGVRVPPVQDDPYVMNVVVAERAGPIGFSPVAEGFVNFGLSGAALYMLVVGAVLSRLDRRRPTISTLVLTAVVLVPLLIQTRNSFVAVPVQLVIGLALWVAFFRPTPRSLTP